MRHAAQGLTLVELLVSLTVLSILLGMGIPAFTQFIDSQRLANATTQLQTALMFARTEALKGHVPVMLDNGDRDWTTGWRIYKDSNNNGVLDPGEPVSSESAGLPSGVVVTSNLTEPRYVRYTPSGRALRLGGAFLAGTLTLCHVSGEQPIRKLVINAAGRVRLQKLAAGTCTNP